MPVFSGARLPVIVVKPNFTIIRLIDMGRELRGRGQILETFIVLNYSGSKFS